MSPPTNSYLEYMNKVHEPIKGENPCSLAFRVFKTVIGQIDFTKHNTRCMFVAVLFQTRLGSIRAEAPASIKWSNIDLQNVSVMKKLSPLYFPGTLTAKPATATTYRLSIFSLSDDGDKPKRKCPYEIL